MNQKLLTTFTIRHLTRRQDGVLKTSDWERAWAGLAIGIIRAYGANAPKPDCWEPKHTHQVEKWMLEPDGFWKLVSGP